MFEEFRYTVNVTHDNFKELDKYIITSPSAIEAARGAHAIAVMTEWDEFKTLEFGRIVAGMPKPAFIFDGRNILDLSALRRIGFRATGIGKPPGSRRTGDQV